MKVVISSSLIFAVFIFIFGCSEKEELPLSKADQNFIVFQMENSKDVPLFAKRNFGKLIISSEAKTFEERAQTTLLAAKKYLEQEDLKYVQVCHLPFAHEVLVGTGYCIATAEYAPDGAGKDGSSSLAHKTWQASAVQGELDEIQSMLLVLWHQKRDKFKKNDNTGQYIDESALRQAISEAIGGKLPPDEIRLPIYTLSQY